MARRHDEKADRSSSNDLFQPRGPPTHYTIAASFTGDANYAASGDSTRSLTLNPEDTTLTAPATQLLLPTGQKATVTATLTDPQEWVPPTPR